MYHETPVPEPDRTRGRPCHLPGSVPDNYTPTYRVSTGTTWTEDGRHVSGERERGRGRRRGRGRGEGEQGEGEGTRERERGRENGREPGRRVPGRLYVAARLERRADFPLSL